MRIIQENNQCRMLFNNNQEAAINELKENLLLDYNNLIKSKISIELKPGFEFDKSTTSLVVLSIHDIAKIQDILKIYPSASEQINRILYEQPI